MFKFHYILAFSFLVSGQVWAWGPIGHRVVGEIAQKQLSRKTLKKLNSLIGLENLSDLANWPDLVKSDPHFKHADSWHYVSIADNTSYEDSPKNPNGDVIKAIQDQTLELKNAKNSKQQKKQALAFLVHLIGDMHQPLHVGRAEDRGGNTILLKWFNDDSNLHEIWDEKLLEMEKMGYTEYANFLTRTIKVEKADRFNLNLSDWVKENMELRPLVYSHPEVPKKYWEFEYRFKVKDKMNLQLYRAGLRLGAWLEANL